MSNTLTVGEKFLLDRRRRGETQAQAAERLGFTRIQYSRLENEEYLDNFADNVEVGDTKDFELCLIYRRRSGKNQKTVAKEIGCSRWWLNKMERGSAPCGKLTSYWEAQQ